MFIDELNADTAAINSITEKKIAESKASLIPDVVTQYKRSIYETVKVTIEAKKKAKYPIFICSLKIYEYKNKTIPIISGISEISGEPILIVFISCGFSFTSLARTGAITTIVCIKIKIEAICVKSI